jgi:hypothetical protein
MDAASPAWRNCVQRVASKRNVRLAAQLVAWIEETSRADSGREIHAKCVSYPRGNCKRVEVVGARTEFNAERRKERNKFQLQINPDERGWVGKFQNSGPEKAQRDAKTS